MAIPFNNVVQDILTLGQTGLIRQELSALGILPPTWGLFDSTGTSVVNADNVTGMEFRQDWNLSNYPLEQGAFETYDKVLNPADIKMTFSAGGSLSNRQLLLNSIEALNAPVPIAANVTGLASLVSVLVGTVTGVAGNTPNFLKLYTVVTPEKNYPNMSVVHIDYARTNYNGGAGLISANVWLTQVNETGTQFLTNSITPSGAFLFNAGQVLPSIITSPLTSFN